MVSTVDSGSAKIGDRFAFRTTREAHAGNIDIPSGTAGEGVVSDVSPAAGSHRGTLSLMPKYLILADGRRLAVAPLTPTAYAARRHVFPFPLPLPGVFIVGGVQNPGGNVRIGPGTTFDVTPAK